jgi:hypothetical protein
MIYLDYYYIKNGGVVSALQSHSINIAAHAA